MRNVNLAPFESVSLFAQSERVNFEQFQDWIVKHRNATVLSKWLLADNCVSLTSELETPTFYQSLAGVTHLEEKVILADQHPTVFQSHTSKSQIVY